MNKNNATITLLEALERTVQELQSLNAVTYNNNNEITSFEEEEEEEEEEEDDEEESSDTTKLLIISREDFQAAQNIIQKSKIPSSHEDMVSDINFSPLSLKIRINVALPSADGVKFEANVDITLPPNYPGDSVLIITKASITDIDLGREINDFTKDMNEKSKELSGSEALEGMIQSVQDYAAEYVANYGYERVDDSWNRPSYFTSYAFSNNGARYNNNHHHHEGDINEEEGQQQQQRDWRTCSSTTSVNYAASGGCSKMKRKDNTNHIKVNSKSKSKLSKVVKPKRRNKSQAKSFEQRLEDLKMFQEEHGHCIVPYTYAKNQPLSNWCSNIRYSYGLVERGLNPTIKMTEERINALRDIGFDFSALKEQHMKRRGDFNDRGGGRGRGGGPYHGDAPTNSSTSSPGSSNS